MLEVIYLIFNEGYSATAGDDWMRPALCEDALRLGRILAELAPQEPEVHGLVALMEIQASRARARVGPCGEPVLLLDQNRAHWDHLLIRRGLAALDARRSAWRRRGAVCAAGGDRRLSRPRAHARGDRLGAHRGALRAAGRAGASPVVELNRAVAVAMAFGPQAGLDLVDALASEPRSRRYHLLPSVRGDLLAKLGRLDEARAEFERAASLTRNDRERDCCSNVLEGEEFRSTGASTFAPIMWVCPSRVRSVACGRTPASAASRCASTPGSCRPPRPAWARQWRPTGRAAACPSGSPSRS